MRLTTSIALLLLLAMALLVAPGSDLLNSFGFGTGQGDQAPQQIHIFSAGKGQLGALNGLRPVANRIVVDGVRYELEDQQAEGLRLLEIDAQGRVGALQHFGVTNSPDELDRLIQFLDQARIDSVFALAVAGRVEPSGALAMDGLGARLSQLFKGLGAQSQPASAGRCSFAYLFARRPQGFVPLAESFSSVQGVQLRFQLEAQRKVYDECQVLVSVDERAAIFLRPKEAQGAGIELFTKLHLGARPYSGLSLPTQLAAPGLASWRLGSDAGGPMQSPSQLSFEARIGLTLGLPGKDSGVHFELLIDGVPVAERVLIDAHASQQGWDLWSTTLDPALRSVDRVQIRATRFGPETSAPLRAFIAQPRMLAGSTGAGGL